MSHFEITIDPTGEYQYIGNNFNLEDDCVQECVELAEESTMADVAKIMRATADDMPLMFPRMDQGRFYLSSFDGIMAILYTLPMTMEREPVHFIWIRL